MSDAKEAEKKDATAAAAPAPAKKGGAIAMVLGIVLPALLSAGGAFGGVKAAGHAGGGGAAHAPEPEKRHTPRPPGPTIALEPFLVSIPDAAKKAHPMKLTVAVEFEATAKEDEIKNYMPRIRDAILTYIRQLSYEQAIDQEHAHKFREELLERVHKSGAVAAERVLVTDLVSQ